MEKIRITKTLIDEWNVDAVVLLDAKWSEAQVRQDLKERGCTPKLAEQILQRAKITVRARHRIEGMRAVAFGFGLIFLGFGMVYIGYVGIPIGNLRAHIGSLYIAGFMMALGGCTKVVIGLYKTLTGSTVEVNPDE